MQQLLVNIFVSLFGVVFSFDNSFYMISIFKTKNWFSNKDSVNKLLRLLIKYYFLKACRAKNLNSISYQKNAANPKLKTVYKMWIVWEKYIIILMKQKVLAEICKQLQTIGPSFRYSPNLLLVRRLTRRHMVLDLMHYKKRNHNFK